MQIYVVKPGDTLYSIGRALSLAPGFLARYNGLREPKEVIHTVCGKELSAKPLLDYFTKKYTEVYPSRPRPGRMCCRYSG